MINTVRLFSAQQAQARPSVHVYRELKIGTSAQHDALERRCDRSRQPDASLQRTRDGEVCITRIAPSEVESGRRGNCASIANRLLNSTSQRWCHRYYEGVTSSLLPVAPLPDNRNLVMCRPSRAAAAWACWAGGAASGDACSLCRRSPA